jgi:hypothetical protein
VGAGQRRFKFIDESATAEAMAVSTADAKEVGAGGGKNFPGALQEYSPSASVKAILQAPTNENTTLIKSFVSLLEVSDSRYAVRCYGIFMVDLPARLGNNPALDAATSAMVALFPSNFNHYNTPAAAQEYGTALSAMRNTLNHPNVAKTADTLCAMYLLMVCQVSSTPGVNRKPQLTR